MSPQHSKGKSLVIATLIATLAAAGGYGLGLQRAGESPAPAEKSARKILFYRNPMGLPDTSPVPKKDPMGMDYLPVFAGEQDEDAASSSLIKISTEKVQKLGVKTEAARLRTLDKVVRAVGRIEADERRLASISAKFEGYVERLHVSVTGQPVSKGQPLFEVYSPELVSAQREYALATQGVEALKSAGSEAQNGMQQLAASSLTRLRNWDISEAQIKDLASHGETRRTLTFRSPVSGVVTEKKAVQGMRFMPGEVLYQVADLSAVWVIADVFEQDIGLVKAGAKARVHINAYPDKNFEGTLSYVYPSLNASTRTIPVRIELANPGLLLKPSMFAQVDVAVTSRGAVLTVPISAVIDSGTRQLVLIEAGAGRYEPRPVKLGARSDSFVEIVDGLKDGDVVVVAANFLIDAESNLKAAISGFGAAGESPAAKPAGASVGHHADGTLDDIDVKTGVLTISHAPVASLHWPAMTMEFKLANPALLKGLKAGATIRFEFVERGPGEWVITALSPAARATP